MRRLTLAAALLAMLAGCAALDRLVQATKAQRHAGRRAAAVRRRRPRGRGEIADRGAQAGPVARATRPTPTSTSRSSIARPGASASAARISARRWPRCRRCASSRKRPGTRCGARSSSRFPAARRSASGSKQYEAGEYTESAKNLQGAISLGLPDKQRADAHKHLAFIHCASNRERQCRDEFRKALAVDPALELAPAEAGHPVWGPIFRSLKPGR